MDNFHVKAIYDRLCFALTDYENHPDDDDQPDDFHDGEKLYEKIVDITNYMAEHM